VAEESLHNPSPGAEALRGALPPTEPAAASTPSDDLLLRDWLPRSQLRVRWEGAPDRPRFPAIDAHSHLGRTPFSGRWGTGTPAELEAVMDASGIAAVVDLDGGWGEALRRELTRWAPLGGRIAVFAGLDYAMWAERADFGDEEARRLRDGVAAGARGLKVWKPLGLAARDATGRIVAVDDPRLDPLWAAAGQLGISVTIHVADPIAFFEPLDRFNERWEELREHLDWRFWPTRPRGEPQVRGLGPGRSPAPGLPPGPPDAPGCPPFDEIIDGLERMVARHPGTTFIGAHVGCVPEDLGRVGEMLAAHSNWNVDIAARIAELGRQPYTARDLFLRWPDRILFGTDAAPDPAWWSVSFRFLETRDESFPYEPEVEDGNGGGGAPTQGRWAIHGLGLPDDVLRAVYAENARRLIGFG
jgi:hypothetical protein